MTEGVFCWDNEVLKFVLDCEEIENINKENKTFFEIIFKVLPEGTIKKKLKEEDINRKGIYIFKVTLNSEVWRIVKLSHNNTFHELHNIIQEAYDFDNDHCYVFCIGSNIRTGEKIYVGNPMGVSDEYEELTIEEANLYKGQKLVYLFDFGDNWLFNITLIDFIENAKEIKNAEVLESKGDSPEQYSMW